MNKPMKITRKSFQFYFDNQYKRGLAIHYIDLLAVSLGRELQSMITGVTANTVTVHVGKTYRLKLYLLGVGIVLSWHRHERKGKEQSV